MVKVGQVLSSASQKTIHRAHILLVFRKTYYFTVDAYCQLHQLVYLCICLHVLLYFCQTAHVYQKWCWNQCYQNQRLQQSAYVQYVDSLVAYLWWFNHVLVKHFQQLCQGKVFSLSETYHWTVLLVKKISMSFIHCTVWCSFFTLSFRSLVFVYSPCTYDYFCFIVCYVWHWIGLLILYFLCVVQQNHIKRKLTHSEYFQAKLYLPFLYLFVLNFTLIRAYESSLLFICQKFPILLLHKLWSHTFMSI